MNTIPVPVTALQQLLGISDTEKIHRIKYSGDVVYIETDKERPAPVKGPRMEFGLIDEAS